MRMNRMRLFVAVTLSEEMRSSLTAYMHQLKKAGVKGNYAPAQNLHMTMAFIGEVSESAPVKEALKSVSFKPFRLSISEMGTFGDILWVGLKGNQAMSAAVKSIRSALGDAGIPYDTKKFVPHITLIRRMAGRWQSVTAPKGDMMVKRISLMKSEVKDGRRVYTEIFSI